MFRSKPKIQSYENVHGVMQLLKWIIQFIFFPGKTRYLLVYWLAEAEIGSYYQNYFRKHKSLIPGYKNSFSMLFLKRNKICSVQQIQCLTQVVLRGHKL